MAATLQTLLSRILMIGINIATSIITARLLGPIGRGEQAAISLWMIVLTNAMTLGIPSSLVYNFKRFPQDKSPLFSAGLGLATGLGAAATLIGMIFMPVLLPQSSPSVITDARWIMLNAPLALILYVCLAVLEADEDFTTANQIRTLIPISTLIGLIGLALAGQLTPFTSSIAYVFSYLPILIWKLADLWIQFRPTWQGLDLSYKRLTSYGLKAYGIDLLNTLSQQADQVLVIRLLPAASMGMYAVAVNLARILNVFQGSLITVLFPKAAARPLEEVVLLTGRAARISLAITGLVGLVIWLFGPLLLQILYGAEYLGAIAVVRILIVETVLAGTTLVLAQAFMALGKPGVVTLLQGLGLALGLPLMMILIPRYGLTGAGMALLSSTSIRFLFVLASYSVVLKTRPPSLLLSGTDLKVLKQMIFK